MRIHDAQIARCRQALELARAAEHVEVAADDDVLTTKEHLLEFTTLLGARFCIERKVYEDERQSISEINIINELLSPMPEVPRLKLERMVAEEPVAVIAEEREKTERRKTAVLVLDV